MKYKVVKLIHPSTHETNYCARVVSSFSVTLHDICENISRECSFSVPDVKGLVSALQEEIEQQLLAGRTVRLGDLGSFRLSLKSATSDTLAHFTPSLIKSVHVRFTPCTETKSRIRLDNGEISLERVGEKLLSDE